MTDIERSVTGSELLAALRLPQIGRVIPLAMVLSNDRPFWPVHGPFLHFNLHSYQAGGRLVSSGTASPAMGMLVDRVEMPLHAGTHVDALNHVAVDDRLFDGSHASQVESSAGAEVLGLETIAPFVGRGVLLDVAAAHDARTLDPGYEISAADIELTLNRQGIDALQTGDVVLINTGWMHLYHQDRRQYFEHEPGIGPEAARLLAEASARAVGADNSALERVPASDPGRPYPVHEILLAGHGIHIFENLDLDALVQAGVGEFLFVGAPLLIRGATGSPLTPLAVI